MGMAHSYDNRALLQAHLADEAVRGRLALVLGAGVSVPFGLPDWSTLLTRLYASVGAAMPARLSDERRAEHFLSAHCTSGADFLQRVRDALYDGVNVGLWELRQNRTLAAVATCARSAHRERPTPVISFNFDDMLESYLEHHGCRTQVVLDSITWAASTEVVVFHPHGLLPYDRGLRASESIVLDQRSFSDIVIGESSRWKDVLRNELRRHTCLFIGVSGFDDHLDALLVATEREHAGRADGLLYWGVRLEAQARDDGDLAMDGLWRRRGVATFRVNDFEDDLPRFLFDVCRLIAPRQVG